MPSISKRLTTVCHNVWKEEGMAIVCAVVCVPGRKKFSLENG